MTPRSNDIPNEESPLLLSGSTKLTKQHPEGEVSLWRRIKEEVNEQMDTAFPTLQSMILTKIPWLVSLRFVGGIGAEELAAAALATTLCNVTGLSLSVGLSSALTTLAGQAKGELHARSKRRRVSFDLAANDREEQVGGVDQATTPQPQQSSDDNSEPLAPLVFLYRGMVIQLALVIPIGIWWIFGIKNVLIALGQRDLLSSMTEVGASNVKTI
jgi:hypothetical protein